MKKIWIISLLLLLLALAIALGTVLLRFPKHNSMRTMPEEYTDDEFFDSAGMEQLRALGYAGGTHEKPAYRQGESVFTPHTAETAAPHLFQSTDKSVNNLLADHDNLKHVEIAGQTRMVLNVLPGSAVSFQGSVKAKCQLLFGVGQGYAQIKPNSLILQLDIFDSDSKLLQQEIVSSIAGAWVDRSVDLGRYSGQTIRLVFSVLSFDPSQDRNPIALAPLLMTHPITQESKKRPHVFFVLIDTLRADALGCYGQAAPVTPHLDRLAREGVLFENTIVQSPHTETSIPSILLGVYPHIHGRMLRDSKHNSASTVYLKKNALSEEHTVIAEVFQNAGYLTYGFYNNILISAKFGFHRGFYGYTDYAAGSGMTDPWGRIAFPTAHLGVEAAIDRIERAPDGVPLFMFLHLLDPHNPFTPPNNYNLSIKRKAKNIDEAAYLGEVAYVDEQIGRLIHTLKQSKLYRDSIILVTSDHGEEFVNPHGRPIGHGRTMFQTLLHVPSIFVFPEMDRPGYRIDSIVESVDLFPTLLELAGLTFEQKLSGESLVPLMKNTERTYNKNEAIAEGIRKGEERKCLIKDNYKLIYYRDSNRAVLYDLQKDPNELEDIATQNPVLAAAMKKHILERFQIEEPETLPLKVNNLGQDGGDWVHTFTPGTSEWKPGIPDIHLSVKPIPDGIQRVDIWADDRLHGNRNYSFGWRWPSGGENPIAVKSSDSSLDLYFEAVESFQSSDVFVRLVDKDNQIYLGSFQGGEVSDIPKKMKTHYPALVRWDFEKAEMFERWRIGQGGTLNRKTIGTGKSQSVMQFESNDRSGSFRAYHVIPKVPSGRRIAVSFELVIESGGVKIELIHPRSAQTIASHTFSIDDSGTQTTKIAPKTMTFCGVTGMSVAEEELLFLISNYSTQNKPTRILFNDIVAYPYPVELDTDSKKSLNTQSIEHAM